MKCAGVLVLACVWHAARSSHWYCDDLDCPQHYSVAVRQSTEVDIYEAGNCFLDRLQRYQLAFGVHCAALCARNGCFDFITGSDGCLLLGAGILPSSAKSALYRRPRLTSPFYEVAEGKPATASSVNPESEGYKWGPVNANDGITSNELYFFHSRDASYGDTRPYLQIDLLKSYAVYKVSFLPRIQQADYVWAYARGENITIYVGSTEVTDGNYAGVYEQLLFIRSQNITAPGQLGWSHLDAPTPKCGRYLVVKKEQMSQDQAMIPLEITEIQVFTKDP